jgi:hypothetical protein
MLRKRTFIWLALCLAGISIKADCLGVTRFVRAIGVIQFRSWLSTLKKVLPPSEIENLQMATYYDI